MDTLFPRIIPGGAQKVYFFTPRLLSMTTPSSAPDLPSQFLASLFSLVGLSKLPGMFWTLSALVPKGVGDLSGVEQHPQGPVSAVLLFRQLPTRGT